MRQERFSAHATELQVWAVRVRPPLGGSLRRWLGYLVGVVIRAFTLRHGGRYSHLLLRLGDRIWEASAEGVREGEASEYRHWSLAVDVFAAPLTAEQRDHIVAWAQRIVGTPYDWSQLLRIALAELGCPAAGLVPDGGEGRMICSEFVALALRQAGLDLAGETPVWRWTPDHIRTAWRRGLVELRGRLDWE
jgi:hypothetical protein